MTKSLATGIVAVLAATSLVACGSPGGPGGQVQLAVPGGEWTGRRTEEFAAAMGAWSNESMTPGTVVHRSYLVRNLDARAGVWTVTVGEPEASANAYFAVGARARLGDAAPPPPRGVAPGDPEVAWLAGVETVHREGIQAAREGDVLVIIGVESCATVAVTDWVAFPDVGDPRYQAARTEPNLRATFTPDTGDPAEYLPGDCTETGSSDWWPGHLLLVLLAVFAGVTGWYLGQDAGQSTS